MYPKHPVASGRGANPKLTVITPRRLASFNFADVGNNNRSLSIKQSIVAEPVGNHSHFCLLMLAWPYLVNLKDNNLNCQN